MKLSEYLQLCEDGLEVTITDTDYDIETYFYANNNKEAEKDLWDTSIYKLSELLEVKRILSNGSISVNLSELIERKIEELSSTELFISCDIDDIMDGIESILSGNVSENWMKKFIDVLAK